MMKYQPKQLTAFLLLLFTTVYCCGQQPSLPHTLLWKITGNGLQKPSYLFGTVHLTDKQLFNFGDSLYKALEEVDGFAIEVHPDSAAKAYMNGDFNQASLRPVSEILSAADLQKIAAKLEARLGKKTHEITEKDLIAYRDNWMQQEMFSGAGKMNVFMDGFLYANAKEMGKWVGGIEDIQDQLQLTEKLDAESIKNMIAQEKPPLNLLEGMKKIYLQQDLSGILAFIQHNTTKTFENRMLIQRNIKMVRRMDSLSQIRSSFFAIGAAHLPGDSGLLNLLSAKGYVVQPVFSSHNIAAETYPFKKLVQNWQTISSEDDVFTIEMPGLPQSEIPSGNGHMKVYVDITTNLFYYMVAYPLKGTNNNPDSLLGQVAKNYWLQTDVLESGNIEKQSVKGKEMILQKDNYYMRLNIFSHPAALVLVMVASPIKQAVIGELAEKYFNSLQLHPASASLHIAPASLQAGNVRN